MRKFGIIFSALLGLLNWDTIIASTPLPIPTSSSFSGPTLALGLGGSFFESHIGILNSDSHLVQADLAVYNPAFAVDLGYGRAINNQYYLGAFITYLYSGTNSANLHLIGSMQVMNYRVTHNHGTLVRLGYVLRQRALLYFEGGVQWSQFRFDFVDTGNASFSTNKTKSGVVWGAGLDYAFSHQFSFGLEYKQSYLANFSKNLDTSLFPDANHIRASQSLGVFLVKLSYQFRL